MTGELAPTTPAYAVLFVCTGNICRSPTAEGVFRQLVRDAGLADRVTIDSAGILDVHAGHAPDRRSVAAARRRGYDLSDLRARQVARADFDRFDLLLAMDDGHRRDLEARGPARPSARVRMFLDYASRRGGGDVPDPYYGGVDGFERVLDLVEDASRGLLAAVRAELRR